MCGITGFISRERGHDERDREILLDQMCASISYRGPDEQGTIVRGRAALGMRRLSIIDIKTGQQPIFTENGNLAIVFNGEIYNYLEIKKDLLSLGHKFNTNSDTEVVIHAFEEFGPLCLERLRGMFAFAIWDFSCEELFLARDRVGKKPLFFSLSQKGDFVFGSELKTLLIYGGIDKEIDLAALDAYLTFGYVPEELCIFKNVRKLLPGHYLTFKDGEITTERYWDFKYREPSEIKTESEYVELVREKIEDAVRVRLISDVPLGAFLSGGVDSSTVVAMMSRISQTPVKTFSIGFDEDSFNELKFARLAADRFGTEHHEFIVTPDLVDVVDELVWHFDEPFADSSALPTFMVSKLAREFVTVVLSGDGGDEVFGGYSRYINEKRRRAFTRVPKTIRTSIFQTLSHSLPHAAIGKNYLFNVSLDSVDRYIDSISQFNGPRKELLYTGDFRNKLNGAFASGERLFKEYAESIFTGNDIDSLMYLDSKTYLPGDILTKVDRMSMANSLEARAPLLDHELIDLVTGIPSEMKIRGSETKYILKKAMEGVVPNEILYREKQGFGVPINEWISSQLRARITEDLTDSKTSERGYFHQSYIQILLKEHVDSRRDYSHQIWLLWIFELWLRRYVDGSGTN